MLIEEGGDPVERDLVGAVIKVRVVGVRNDHEFLRFGSRRESGLAEIAGMRFSPWMNITGRGEISAI